MEWIVYRFNFNSQEIKTFNIFEHGSFYEYIKKAAKKYKTKEEFAEQLRSELRYYFWSRSEYELVIEITEDNNIFLNPWVGCKEPEKARINVANDTNFDWENFAKTHIEKQIYSNKAKIDIYDQIDYVWDEFVEYCWNNRKQLKNK